MRIGFDIDGVLANFVKAYQHLCVQVTGKDLFVPSDVYDPPCWDWPQFRGYTDAEVSTVWAIIKRDDTFWLNLEPHENNVSALSAVLLDLERKHDVYYVTSRVGVGAKRQTKLWLMDHLRYHARCRTEPTVLISREKGKIAHALKLDAFLDDNWDNVVDVVNTSPATRTYLLNRSYNTRGAISVGNQHYTRVDTLGQMLDKEISLGNL